MTRCGIIIYSAAEWTAHIVEQNEARLARVLQDDFGIRDRDPREYDSTGRD